VAAVFVPAVDIDALERACREGPLGPPPDVGPDLDGARSLVRWLVERVARARYVPHDVRRDYCARSTAAVLREARVPFTAPCADLSGASAALLARAGISFTLVLTGIARPLRPVRFQCGLEVELDGRTFVLGFGMAGTSLYEGRFEPVPSRPWIYRRRPTELALGASFLQAFEPDGRDGVERLVPGYSLERDLASHVRRSGRLWYAIARRKALARVARPRATNLAAAMPWR
jgi:hypothetical protein